MTARRAFLGWLSAATLTPLPGRASASQGAARGRGRVRIEDARLSVQFDERMHCRLVELRDGRAHPLTGFDTSEHVVLAPMAATAGAGAKAPASAARTVANFGLETAEESPVSSPFGPGRRLQAAGLSAEGLRKQVTVTLLHAFPGVALLEVSYTNRTAHPMALQGWSNAAHRLAAAPRHAGGYWTYSGASHADRRDWVQPVKRGFDQANFMGMNASDYGGGTPVTDVWRRDVGLAIGHLDRSPRLVSLPVRAHGDEVALALRSDVPLTLEPGGSFKTPTTFLAVHRGDCFVALDTYRRLMAQQGIEPARPPASAYEPMWCAWGYEREFSLPLVKATLPKVQELGLKWAVLDDGWQRLTGDWRPDSSKFPNGEADMKALVREIHDRGMKARLWIAPLAVAPGSEELHQHTDMLLLNADGAVQDITWWNSFYLCPSYAKTQQRMAAVVKTIIGDWGFDGLKVDGQHLNGVAPCYNKAHRHARPEDAVEHLSDFYRVLHEAAHAANPEAVVEVCPCGTAYAFHNLPYMDQAPASDPLSSWQIRHKGKTLKALMGPWAAYAGDHVELSDRGEDFASTVGIGGVVATKFTWPVDPKPKDSFLLTPERERHWRRWIGLHNERQLTRGRYRGELYDIAFDKPETHVVEKDGVLHYAFYAPQWNGPVTLRGLGPGRWRVRDYVNDRVLGVVSAERAQLQVSFNGSLLIEARAEAA